MQAVEAHIKKNQIILGDCLAVLKQLPSSSINLIVTSPPYADSRSNTYGGIHPNSYVAWFLPIALELQRILTDDGTFILNIKEKAVNCERGGSNNIRNTVKSEVNARGVCGEDRGCRNNGETMGTGAVQTIKSYS